MHLPETLVLTSSQPTWSHENQPGNKIP